MSNEDAIRRLRAKGQPIRLFGESDKDRRLRLRALELIEENDAKEGGGGLNDFKRVLAGMDEDIDAKEAEKRMLNAKGSTPNPDSDATGDAKGKKADKSGKSKESKPQEVLDLGLIQRDPNALYPLVYRALKDVLNEWGQAMDEREGVLFISLNVETPFADSAFGFTDHVKRSTQGKLAAATQVSSAEYLKPLFRMLKQRVCAASGICLSAT